MYELSAGLPVWLLHQGQQPVYLQQGVFLIPAHTPTPLATATTATGGGGLMEEVDPQQEQQQGAAGGISSSSSVVLLGPEARDFLQQHLPLFRV